MQRNRVAEVMDDEALGVPLREEALRGLARINALSFAARRFWKPISEYARAAGKTFHVLDLATGGGDVLLALAERARREHVRIKFSGCDKSAAALNFASRAAAAKKLHVEFFPLDILAEHIPAGYDMVINSLFLHHFDPGNVVAILAKMRAAADCVLVSDLRRSRADLVLAHVATRLLSRSPVVHIDGPRSVQAAYSIPEMRQLAERAGLHGSRLDMQWPCRMMLQWNRPK